VDAVVGLGGVAHRRPALERARKQLIRDSRNVPTEVLAAAVAEHGVPDLLVGVGGGLLRQHGDRVTDESRPSGTGFLAEVCRDWEAATQRPSTRARGW
jgi:NAD dependent epimerase/dehydratase family enzyme